MKNESGAWLSQLATPGLDEARIGLLVALLMLAAFIDVRTFRIPNWLTVGGAVLGLGLNTAISWHTLSAAWAINGFLWALGGLAAGLVIMLPMYALRVMGAGDVKLMAMVGAFLGLSQIVPAVLFVFITGGVAALVFVVARRQLAQLILNLREVMFGMAFSVIATQRLPGMPPGASVGKLPYGVSISAGTILYVAMRQLGYL